MQRYWIVLFKNKKKYKIINKFVSLERAESKLSNILEKSNEILYETRFENGIIVEYEIGLVDTTGKITHPVYKVDSLGRNIRISLEDDGFTLLKAHDFKKEESIYDLQLRKKISVNFFVKTYLSSKELKLLSILNNKLLVQINESIFLFSLKNEIESERFINILSNEFMKQKRSDCIFVKDTSSAQRKYLINLLSSRGFDKKVLYRHCTTFPVQKE